MRRQVFCFVVGPGERDHGFRRGCGFTPASFFGTGPRQCNGNSAPRTTPGNPLLHPPDQPSWVQQTRPTPMLALQLALPRSPPASSARRRWCPATASPAGGARRLRGELGGSRRVLPSRTPPGDGPYTDRLLRLVAQATCSSHPSPPPGGPPPDSLHHWTRGRGSEWERAATAAAAASATPAAAAATVRHHRGGDGGGGEVVEPAPLPSLPPPGSHRFTSDCRKPLPHGDLAILLQRKCGNPPPANAGPRLLAASPCPPLAKTS